MWNDADKNTFKTKQYKQNQIHISTSILNEIF